jgi:Methyltransferase domain
MSWSVKELLRTSVDALFVRPLKYLRFKTDLGPRPVTLLQTMHNNAVRESAAYAEEHMQNAMAFEDKTALRDYVIGLCPEGINAEFGVANGASINYFARCLQLRKDVIFGFDSFEGLKDNWPGLGLRQGHFSLGGKLPDVEPNVVLKKGWFDQTIPKFLEADLRSIAFAHFDCDTYNSTKTVLNLISSRLVAGTIILFDEYFGYRGWKREEWKAWQEFVESTKVTYEYIAFSNGAVALRVVQPPV